MNYWLLTTEYPPMHGGGISTYCRFTAQMLAANGNSVSVFVNDDTETNFSITAEATGIRLVKFNSNREKIQQSLGYTARLSYSFAGIVKELITIEGKPDFIESQDYLGIGYYLTQLKHLGYYFLAGIPIVLTIHSPAFIYLLYNRVPVFKFPDYWTGEMEKQSIAAADALIFPTNFLLEEVKKHMPVSCPNTAIIANPYKSQVQTSSAIQKNKIVYYGKLSPQKGSFELLSYCKKMWDSGFTHPLHIIGGTDIVYHPEMQTMGQLVQQKYADYIVKGLLQMHGKITPAQTNEYLKDAHVVIVPSIVDNMPYVVMEAMAQGKIVLASVQGGQGEMIEDGVSGFLFSHDEPGSFEEQLLKILSLSDEALTNISNAAQKKIANDYSFTTVINRKIKFLENIAPIHLDYFPFLYQENIQSIQPVAETKELLSVVIPFYNMGNYIEDCLQSIFASSYKDIEVIIVNDGSTDNESIQKLATLSKNYAVTIINRNNAGLAETRNTGAKAAKGEFLAFVDADDKVADTYYEKAISVLQQKQNVFFAGSWVQYFENSKNIWPTFTPQPPYALVHNPINSSGLVYKRSAFISRGLNDKKTDYGMEDYESVINMMANGFNGVVLPEILFYYRVRTGSMFRNVTSEKLLYSNKYIAEKHKNYYTRFATDIINLLNANGPGYLYDNPTFATKVSLKNKPGSAFSSSIKNFIKKNEPLKRLALKLLKNKSGR
ncbi:MAG: glycosyltransferase [Chitinophagaceae bacterium]